MPENDGAIPVRLLIHVKDTWNFIIIPYPKYDSNEGFSITLKGRDYNFLGTMSPLRVDLGYMLDNSSQSSFNFMIDSDIPFHALGLDWNINFDHLFELGIGEPLYYQNVTGLSLQVPWNSTAFTFGFNHYVTINEQVSEENKANYGLTNDYYDLYGSAELFASWRIPLGIEVGEFGQLSYTPKVSTIIHYPYNEMDEPRKPSAAFSQSIGFGRVDWIGNQRKGLSASISNSNVWYFDRTDAPLAVNIDTDVAFYWPFNDIIGFSSQLKNRQKYQWSDLRGWLPIYGAGDVIRGVLDRELRANFMLSLNLDFPIRVLRFLPSEWFDKPGLHFLDFEMYVSPFLDLAFANGTYSSLGSNREIKFSFDNLISATGLEVIIYPAIMRSLLIRASIGYNIEKIWKEGLQLSGGFFPEWHEIYIGVDLYY